MEGGRREKKKERKKIVGGRGRGGERETDSPRRWTLQGTSRL